MSKLGIPGAACFISAISSAAYVIVKGASWWWPVIFIIVGLFVLVHSEISEEGKKDSEQAGPVQNQEK